ncbi:hypothetical protein BJ508DRAFT_17066 [Ascobolus immersus RN42]|uniref:Uncharacterized protein n=1 Tax=Ascobolus immersus RN42 TaxID=1160509 RepID=A0A3N4HRX1_ASCIM|nr:hypothetical protein BJ508DRAFT_17066 [Ascobolus immersus RN42]
MRGLGFLKDMVFNVIYNTRDLHTESQENMEEGSSTQNALGSRSFMPISQTSHPQKKRYDRDFLEFCEDKKREQEEAFLGPYAPDGLFDCYPYEESEKTEDSWDDTTDDENPRQTGPKKRWYDYTFENESDEEKRLRALGKALQTDHCMLCLAEYGEDTEGATPACSMSKREHPKPKSRYAQGLLTIPDVPGASGLAIDPYPVQYFSPIRVRRENESLEEYLASEKMFFIRYMVDFYLEHHLRLHWEPNAQDRVGFLTTPRTWKRIARRFKLTNEEYIKYFQ